ncbi:hypothetical protein B0H11DRAFT_1922646 [Mycena galericulata]|nr:hypothetical protein B0H11DRAFT_1922646 [Mycena galericulata]
MSPQQFFLLSCRFFGKVELACRSREGQPQSPTILAGHILAKFDRTQICHKIMEKKCVTCASNSSHRLPLLPPPFVISILHIHSLGHDTKYSTWPDVLSSLTRENFYIQSHFPSPSISSAPRDRMTAEEACSPLGLLFRFKHSYQWPKAQVDFSIEGYLDSWSFKPMAEEPAPGEYGDSDFIDLENGGASSEAHRVTFRVLTANKKKLSRARSFLRGNRQLPAIFFIAQNNIKIDEFARGILRSPSIDAPRPENEK